MAKQELETVSAKYTLTVSAKFIGQTVAEKKNWPALKWEVSLQRNGKSILTTDYAAGVAHCPSYKTGARSVSVQECIDKELATGIRYCVGAGGKAVRTTEVINPSPLDVIHSLVTDASALDYSSFEDWASDMGYETDSRKAEKIYQECLAHALKLRNSLGEEGLRELREAAQDY